MLTTIGYRAEPHPWGTSHNSSPPLPSPLSYPDSGSASERRSDTATEHRCGFRCTCDNLYSEAMLRTRPAIEVTELVSSSCIASAP